jgi:PAS domain S-box-containing protein
VIEHIKKHPSLFNYKSESTSIDGLVQIDERAMIISSRPVVKTDGKGPIKGAILAGRYIEGPVFDDLLKMTRLRLEMAEDDEKLPRQFKNVESALHASNGSLVKIASEDHLEGYLLYKDVYGKDCVYFKALIPRTIYKHSQRTMFLFLIATLIGAFLLLIVTTWATNKFVIGPIVGLNRKIKKIAKSGNPAMRLDVEGEDEISGLAGEMNTMLKNLEQRTIELRESENRFRLLTEGGFEGVVIHENGAILDYNKQICELTGYKPEELETKNLFSLFTFETSEAVAQAAALDYEEAMEIEVERKDGAVITLECRGKSIKMGGRSLRIMALRDVTDRKQAELEILAAKEKAENATKLKDKFVSLVSHDLRAPMATAMGLLGLAERGGAQKPDEKKRAELISKAHKSLAGLVDMIDQLLDLSRLQTGSMTVAKKSIIARHLASASLEHYAPIAEKKGVKLVNKIPTDMKLFADHILIGEVLKNLISNAIKFCRAGDTITVGAPDILTISVQDTGLGIPENVLPNLFRPEVKTTTIGTDGEKGTGLGLPYCKEIMTAHHGDLTVSSIVGKGTTFSMKFVAEKPLVLVVDDQDVQRTIIKKHLLELSDVEVIEAGNGVEALALLKSASVSLLITDLGMPEMDGFALLKEVRGNPSFETLPIIVNSSASSDQWDSGEAIDNWRKALELGANDFFSKPIVPEDFSLRVGRYLA